MRTASAEAAATDRLQDEVNRMRGISGQISKFRSEIDKLDAAAVPLLASINGRGAWLQIIDDLNARLPKENIWITELAPTSNGTILGQTGPGAAAAPTPPPSTPPPGRGRGGAAVKNAPARPTIDGVFIKGLYLSNPEQQEIVVDYFRNLLDSKIFEVDANNQSQVIRPSTPTSTEWAYPYELRLKLRQPLYLP